MDIADIFCQLACICWNWDKNSLLSVVAPQKLIMGLFKLKLGIYYD